MTGRRWSDGLHQAVEAKEGVAIERETQTLATITIQNYFRLYQKLAGMTGTAETEASEFFDIYKLGVLVIPTNRPVARKDGNDSVYKTRREKFNAVLKEIKEVHSKDRPILVGTISVEVSERLSRMLKREGIDPFRPQRQVPSAGSRNRRPRRPARRRDHRHEHGRPRHRHQAGARRAELRRPARHRHRTSRIPPHRPPVARPLRPPGRPRLIPLFHLPRRRPDAAVRLRPHRKNDGEDGARGRPGTRASVPQPLDSAGPEARRTTQLPDSQAHARVRRRDEQAARGHLWLPQRNHPGPRGSRPPHGHHGRSGRPESRAVHHRRV